MAIASSSKARPGPRNRAQWGRQARDQPGRPRSLAGPGPSWRRAGAPITTRGGGQTKQALRLGIQSRDSPRRGVRPGPDGAQHNTSAEGPGMAIGAAGPDREQMADRPHAKGARSANKPGGSGGVRRSKGLQLLAAEIAKSTLRPLQQIGAGRAG